MGSFERGRRRRLWMHMWTPGEMGIRAAIRAHGRWCCVGICEGTRVRLLIRNVEAQLNIISRSRDLDGDISEAAKQCRRCGASRLDVSKVPSCSFTEVLGPTANHVSWELCQTCYRYIYGYQWAWPNCVSNGSSIPPTVTRLSIKERSGGFGAAAAFPGYVSSIGTPA